MGSTADGLNHFAFAVVLCLEQAAAGRKFALEHAAKASQCGSDILKVLMWQSGASRVNLGQCMMGLTSRDSLGAPFARELTSIATNSNGIALELQKFQCDGTRGHASVSEATNEGPHDVASLYDDFDFFFVDVSGQKIRPYNGKESPGSRNGLLSEHGCLQRSAPHRGIHQRM